MASYVSTSTLNLQNSDIDFIPISFYKIFGYPTGLGALLIKNTALQTLSKKYFGGGTVEAVGVEQFFHVPRHNPAEWFEDGTLPYQQILALKFCLDYINSLPDGMSTIQNHALQLSQLAYNMMSELVHDNGMKLCEIYSQNDYTNSTVQGPIINFNLKSKTGSYIGFGEVGRLASLSNITLRTGCCCNVGACIKWLNLSDNDTLSFHQAGHKCGDGIDLIEGKPTGSVRISFGHHNTESDVNTFIFFLKSNFIVKTYLTTANQLTPAYGEDMNISDLFIYPVKSCAAVKVPHCKLSGTGFLYDRTWSIVNHTGQCITQKQNNQLCRIKPEIAPHELLLFADGFERVSIPLNPEYDKSNTQSIQTCSMKVCGKRRVVLDCGDAVSDWLSNVLLVKCRLVRQRASLDNKNGDITSLANDSQYLMITRPSLIKLNNYIQHEMNTKSDVSELLHRFRPNIVLKGGKADIETTWTSITISNHTFTCMGPCERCYMVSIDQVCGQKSAEPLRSLKLIQETSKPTFGIHLKHDLIRSDGELTLSIGDRVVPSS